MCLCLQSLLLLNPTERFLTEQSLNHHAFQTLRLVERPGPPTPTPARSSKRKPHHGDNTTPSRSAASTIVSLSSSVSPCCSDVSVCFSCANVAGCFQSAEPLRTIICIICSSHCVVTFSVGLDSFCHETTRFLFTKMSTQKHRIKQKQTRCCA